MTNKSNATVTITPERQDPVVINQLKRLLHEENSHPKLVGSSGEEISLPESFYAVLRDVVSIMASGQAIHLVPENGELTTQEAANFLNMSRPSLIKLLNEGTIPHSKVGTHRRIRFRDLIAFKEQRDAERRSTLREFTEFLQEEGFYDYDVDDFDCQQQE